MSLKDKLLNLQYTYQMPPVRSFTVVSTKDQAWKAFVGQKQFVSWGHSPICGVEAMI